MFVSLVRPSNIQTNISDSWCAGRWIMLWDICRTFRPFPSNQFHAFTAKLIFHVKKFLKKIIFYWRLINFQFFLCARASDPYSRFLAWYLEIGAGRETFTIRSYIKLKYKNIPQCFLMLCFYLKFNLILVWMDSLLRESFLSQKIWLFGLKRWNRLIGFLCS